jgi:hypothetical protein
MVLCAKKSEREKKENVARTALTGKTTTTTNTIISLGNREKEQRNIQEGIVAKSRLV